MTKHNLDSDMNYKKVVSEDSSLKPWSIVGAGPVGSMQALMLAALFPGQPIHVFDRYRQNIRGHGLAIHRSTVLMMIKELKNAKKQTEVLLKDSGDKDKTTYYQQVIDNIDKVNTYLKKSFTTATGGAFIRTHKISEMLQEFTKQLSNNSVQFHLDKEVTEKHLNECKEYCENSSVSSSAQNDDFTQSLLNQSDIIFGADGAHSRLREVVFEESDKDLEKDVLAHLLEIKLDMKNQANKMDKFTKSVLATLKQGDLHIWNQSRDGTATLHIFIDKKTYDSLLGKKSNKETGDTYGKFTNPYRRLTQLPTHLRKPIDRSLTDVVGINNFDPKSIKVTAIPMHVYKAKKLVKQEENGKTFILTGDAAIGLALERGFNNGLYVATHFGTALFKQKNNPTSMDPIGDLTVCEQKLKEEADKKITIIKKETSLIQGLQNTLGKLLSRYIRAKEKVKQEGPELKPTVLQAALKELKQVIPGELMNDIYAPLILDLDRLHIALKSISNRLKKQPNSEQEEKLIAIIKNTVKYTQQIINGQDTTDATDAIKNTVINSKLSTLCKQVMKTGNSIQFYTVLDTTDAMDLIARAIDGIGAYHKHKASPSLFSSGILGRRIGRTRSQTYLSPLNDPALSETTKLGIIYAILSSKNDKTLQRYVANSMMVSKHTNTSINIVDLKNAMAKIIAQKIDKDKTKEFFGLLSNIASKINTKSIPVEDIDRLASYDRESVNLSESTNEEKPH